MKELQVSICIVLNSSRDKSNSDFYHIVISCAYFSVDLVLGVFTLSLHHIPSPVSLLVYVVPLKKKQKKNKVKIASKKCRINHVCFKTEAIPKDLYACSYFFSFQLELGAFRNLLLMRVCMSLVVSMPFISFFFFQE